MTPATQNRPRRRARWRARAARAGRWLGIAVMVYALAVAILIPLYRFVPPPASTLMVWRLVQGYGLTKDWVSLDAMAPALPAAVVASEDAKFCTHNGVDWGALGSALEDVEYGGKARGASTLTMQTAKNLFLWPARSYVRKGLEVPLAYMIDLIWPKRRILEVYLNVAEWAPGVYGAEAAARHHFKRRARALTSRQAAPAR